MSTSYILHQELYSLVEVPGRNLSVEEGIQL